MPDTQGFLAIAIMVLIATVVLILLTKPPQIDERTSGVLMTIVGVLIACMKDVYAFFFGSSKGSKDKDDALTKIATEPVPPVPPLAAPVSTTTTTTDDSTVTKTEPSPAG
jgi:hypothetical protein